MAVCVPESNSVQESDRRGPSKLLPIIVLLGKNDGGCVSLSINDINDSTTTQDKSVKMREK